MVYIVESGRRVAWSGTYAAALLFASRRTLRGIDCRACLEVCS